MYRFIALLLLLGAALAGCSGTATEQPLPDKVDLLKQAAANIRATKTFRMQVERTGAEYRITTDLGTAVFKSGKVQYIAPDVLQATVRVIALGLPIDLDFFFREDKQWLRGIWTNNTWQTVPIAPGFNPRSLIAEETGFNAALKALQDLKMVGREQLEDGTAVYHISAAADGKDVSAFMAGLFNVEGKVLADVYIDEKSLVPVRFVIVQTEAKWAPDQEPTKWTIDVYDVNAPATINDPEATAEPTESAG